MKKAKKLMAIILASIMTVTLSLPAFATTSAPEKNSSDMTIEERINSLTLTPQPRPDWETVLSWYDFSRIERINSMNLSNYEKMRAVFIDIAQQTRGFSCTSHASLLGAAYEMLGFKVYGASGGVRTADGKTPAWSASRMGFVKEGYTAHSWIAVEIDGTSNVALHKEIGTVNGVSYEYEILKIVGEDISIRADSELNGEIIYFDVNLYGTHGMAFDLCLAVPTRNTSWYTAVGVGAHY
jgi:hypothetical protein